MRNYGSYVIMPTHQGTIISIKSIAPQAAIRLKALFKSVKTGDRPPIRITMTNQAAEDFDWFLKRYPMSPLTDASKGLLDRAVESSQARWDSIEQAISGQTTIDIPMLDSKLRPYQSAAVASLMISKRMLCGDDVGLGKTFVALGLLANAEARPALVVVQSHLIKQWQEMITKHLGLVSREIKTKNPNVEKLKPADVYVTSYTRISGWVDPMCSGAIKSVVFDEAQELRLDTSDKYAAAKSISKACEYVLGLSATPVYNYGIEVFNVLKVISPDIMPSRDEFLREWCLGDFKGRVQDPKALGAWLRDQQVLLRRTRAEVGLELEETNRIVHTIPYDQSEEDKVIDLAKKLAMKTISGSFVESGQAAREFDMMLRMATGMAKAKSVAAYVKILLDNGEPVLLAGWHRDVYDVWLKELAEYKPVLYTGSESAVGKHKSKEDFIKGRSKLMIISLRSGVGLDGLQGVCSTVVFGELDWSPQVHDQVIGRLRRDGQKTQVTAMFLVCDGGSDPPMVDLLGLKRSQNQGVMDPNAEVVATVSDDGRIKQMARKFLEMKESNAKGNRGRHEGSDDEGPGRQQTLALPCGSAGIPAREDSEVL